jgi:tRNA pseudouridine38-40 synthase
MRYKLTIAYEGTPFHGWQIQPNGVSIQALIQEALLTILREQVQVVGAGRTDAGVHALGQVAHFNTSREEPSISRLQRSLNALLPKEIRIMKMERVLDAFHAQYSAQAKVYRYHIYLDRVLSPFRRNFVWHIPYTLQLQKMLDASRYFIGTHDFTSFANEAHLGVASRDPVRTLHRLELIPEQGGIVLEFEADGYLYKMVRNIVGTLVDVASDKYSPEEIPEILAAQDRTLAGMAAPPQGLFLVSITYPEGLLA